MTTDLVEVKAPGLIERFGGHYGIEPKQVLNLLKSTAFRTEVPATNEQMMALMIVAEQYHLNPFTKELYAFPDKKSGGIVPVVSVDGWARIINEHPMLDGFDFSYDPESKAMTCIMHRKDRAHPVRVPEYMSECYRDTAPWRSHPLRMLRHKALIQAARLAFGFAGIYDEDEAHRIVNGGPVDEVKTNAQAKRVTAILAGTNPSAEAGAPDPLVIDLPNAESDMTPPSVEELRTAIINAFDADDASQVLDMARSYLPDSEFEGLAATWRAKWQQADQQPEQTK